MARLRRLTAWTLAAATGVAGVLAGVAASSAHGRAVVTRSPSTTRAATTPDVPLPAATVPFGRAADPGGITPSSAPVPSVGPPVVVSGGS